MTLSPRHALTTSISTVGMPREKWLELRRGGACGSDAGPILGLSEYQTDVDVYLVKKGIKPDFEGNNNTYWGTKLENLVAEEYEIRKGWKVRRHNYITRVGIRVGNVDRLVVDRPGVVAANGVVKASRILEAKTAKARSFWGNGVPPYIVAQCFHYMSMFPSVDVVDVAVFFKGDTDFDIFPIERDNDTIAAMVERIEEWWQRHIIDGVLPEPKSEDDCRALWAKHRGGVTITADAPVEKAVAELARIDGELDALGKAKAAARKAIMAKMADAETLVDALGRPLVTWKANKDSEVVDWEAVAKAAGATADTIKKFTITKPGARVLRPKEQESEKENGQ